MPPQGVLHLLFVAVRLRQKCSPQMHGEGQEAIKYPLKTAGTFSDSHYCLIKQKDVRGAGHKREVFGLSNSSHSWSKHS